LSQHPRDLPPSIGESPEAITAKLKDSKVLDMFKSFAALIASQLDSELKQ